MITPTASIEIGTEVRRSYSIPARYLGLPKGAKGQMAFDLGTVVGVDGERVQVLWHTIRADLPAGAYKTRVKRTWVNRKILEVVSK